MPTNPERRPTELHLRGGPTGLLMIHGFTGSTSVMTLVGDFLHRRGLTVLAPLLPGHGTSPEDLNAKRWIDWVNHTSQALERLRAECPTVFVAGLSLGALLSLYLAATGGPLHGVIAYSPPIVMAHPRAFLTPSKYLIPSLPKPKHYFADPNAEGRLWDYRVAPLRAYHELLRFNKEVGRNLDKVHCPILIVHSTSDAEIHGRSANATYEGVRSEDKEVLTLRRSGHVVTLDVEWEQVAQSTFSFIERHSGGTT